MVSANIIEFQCFLYEIEMNRWNSCSILKLKSNYPVLLYFNYIEQKHLTCTTLLKPFSICILNKFEIHKNEKKNTLVGSRRDLKFDIYNRICLNVGHH